MVDELLEELLHRRDADALDSLGRPARDELRRVAREHDCALLPCLTEPLAAMWSGSDALVGSDAPVMAR